VVHKINPTYTFKEPSGCIKNDDSDSEKKNLLISTMLHYFLINLSFKGNHISASRGWAI